MQAAFPIVREKFNDGPTIIQPRRLKTCLTDITIGPNLLLAKALARQESRPHSAARSNDIRLPIASVNNRSPVHSSRDFRINDSIRKRLDRYFDCPRSPQAFARTSKTP